MQIVCHDVTMTNNKLCSNCERLQTCTELCAEAIEYADQDYVGERETPLTRLGHAPLPRSVDWASGVDLTARERQIVTLIASGLSRPDVAQLLGITRANIRQVLRRAHAKL